MERIDKINKLIDSIALYDYLEGTSEIKYKKENELKVYPNPFQNELTIEGIQNLGSYRLMTLEGELVKEGFLSDKKNTISMSD